MCKQPPKSHPAGWLTCSWLVEGKPREAPEKPKGHLLQMFWYPWDHKGFKGNLKDCQANNPNEFPRQSKGLPKKSKGSPKETKRLPKKSKGNSKETDPSYAKCWLQLKIQHKCDKLLQCNAKFKAKFKVAGNASRCRKIQMTNLMTMAIADANARGMTGLMPMQMSMQMKMFM